MAKIALENHPLERAVIGALLADTMLFWQFKTRANPELFTVITHAKICKIMHELVEEGRNITIPFVISRLGREENSDFSPEGYLATLIADDGDPDEIPQNFADLEDMWARRQMAKLGQDLIKQSTEDNGLDAMGRLEKAKDDLDSLGDPLGNTVRLASTIAAEVVQRVADASEREETTGLDVGLKGLQDLTGPLMPGRVYLIAGPPGSGKSALVYQVLEHIAEREPALVVSIEMEGEEMVERDLASRTGISADKIERAAVNADEIESLYNAARDMGDNKLYIDATTMPMVSQVRAKAMRMQRLKGLAVAGIDHLLYLAPADRKQGEFQNIRLNMQGVKKMAKDLKIPIILLAQLKKEFGEGPWQQLRRPNVGDIYGGSAVEQEADVVLLIHREEYLLGRKEPDEGAKDRGEWEVRMDKVRGKAELVLAKRRGGKGFGVRTLYFDGPRTRFSDQPPRSNRPGAQASLLTDDDMAAARDM